MLTGFQTKKYEDLLDTMFAVDDWQGHPKKIPLYIVTIFF